MQTVSESWKSNHKKTIVDESFVEVSLDVADPDAIADASSSDNGASYISNTTQIVREVDKVIVPYLTLEQNMWLLDGKREVIPTENYQKCGYIGDIVGDSYGVFSEKTPLLTVSFTKVHNNLIPAITITWGSAYGEYAVDFDVTVYNGNTVVASKEVLGNTLTKTVVDMDIIGYDRIDIAVKKWCLPYHRARVEEIFVGLNKVYTKANLFSYSHTQTVDPVSSSLPKAEVSFSIDNVDNSYNPHNSSGMTQYLMERQEVQARYGYKLGNSVEWIEGGTFYLSEWDAPQNGLVANFKARDLLEYMTDTFYGGLYNPNGVSLYALAEQVLRQANLPLNRNGSVRWIIDESLESIYTVAPLPVDTLANCLLMIANAGGCVLYQDRQGMLRIEKISNISTDYSINLTNSFSKSEISLSKPLKQVSVLAYQYYTESEKELYKGSMAMSGTTSVTLMYSTPAVNVVANITGGTLLSAEYYTNACNLEIAPSNTMVDIVVTGTELSESQTEIVIQSGTQGETITVDNPLITSNDRAIAIGQLTEAYHKNRMSLSSDWRADPRLDALDIIENKNEYGDNKVRVTNVEYSYNGAFRGKCEGKVT